MFKLSSVCVMVLWKKTLSQGGPCCSREVRLGVGGKEVVCHCPECGLEEAE